MTSGFRTLVVSNGVPTDDQIALFSFRDNAEPDDLVIYFVRTLVPSQAGCAVHPPEKPGAIVSASLGTEWALAHEIGHVLGLEHVECIDRLFKSPQSRRIAAITRAAYAQTLLRRR
jgi:hypothetical protein